MNRNNEKILFSLISSAISGDLLSDKLKKEFSPESTDEIFSVAKKHDVLHLVSSGIEKNGLLEKGSSLLSKLQNYTFGIVFRYEQLNYELSRVCAALEECGVDFIPLKGSVLRKYYPEPWMRTSCDIDILVKQDDIEKASAYFCEKLGYEKGATTSHDTGFFSQNKLHIELHYTLIEDGLINDSAKVLERVWDTAEKKQGYNHFYEMPDQMFYFYHIAHMAKHFEHGGCGIRPFIDLYFLDKVYEKEICDRLLSEGGLLKFAESARKLCGVWLYGKDYDSVTSLMGEFVINGGVYGTESNRVTLQQQRRGGAFKYALSRIFLPYDIIKFYFPILQKHKWLLPFVQVYRWIRLVFKGKAKRGINELKMNSEISSSKKIETRRFLDKIGL